MNELRDEIQQMIYRATRFADAVDNIMDGRVSVRIRSNESIAALQEVLKLIEPHERQLQHLVAENLRLEKVAESAKEVHRLYWQDGDVALDVAIDKLEEALIARARHTK